MTSPRRVLLIANEAHRTGAPRAAIETARALSSSVSVTTVVKRGTALLPEFRSASTEVVASPGGSLHDWVPRLRNRGLPTGTRWIERRIADRVVDAHRPDLVYGHTIESADYLASAIDRDIPTVLHLHEPHEMMVEVLRPFGLGPDRRPDVVVGCARSISRDAERFFGMADGAAITVPEPVDVRQVQRRAGAPRPTDMTTGTVVLSVGSLTEVKGVDLWLDTIEATSVDAQFAWIGSGPRHGWLERQIHRRGLTDRVQLLGPRPDPVPYMAAADVLLLPSRHEGMPLVLLEALSAGTPCVGFAVNGVPDAIGEDGACASPLDTKGLALAVASVLEDEAQRERVLREAPERMFADFDVQAFHRATRALVERTG